MGDLVEGMKAFMTLAAAKEIIDLNDRLATLQRGLEAATGSQKGAADALDFVRSVADRLGVSVFDLSQSYLKITAAAKGTQLEGKATEQIFSSLAGAMSIVGASADDVDSAMNAVAQMMSKGVISAEELRGQLGDVLPGAAQQAAQSLLVTNAEFNKMLESGEVIASEFLPKFAVQLEQAMGGGGQQVETFAATVARLQNRLIDLATGEVGQALTRFATALVGALEPAARGVEFLTSNVANLAQLLAGIAAGEVTQALDDFGRGVNDASAKLMGFKTEAEQAAERQKQLAEAAKTAKLPIEQLQDAVARGELKAMPEQLQAAVTELRKTGDAATATEQATAKFFASANKNLNFEGVINLATALKAVGQEAKGAGGDIQDALGKALDKLTDEQLEQLKQQAEQAMAKASQGSEEARKAFADLGLVVDTVANVQLKRAAVEAEKVANATRTHTGAVEDLAEAQLSGLKAEIATAKAKGETWVVQQKSVELAKAEAEWATIVAAAKQAEIAAEQALLQAKIAIVKSGGLKTEADKQEYVALQLKNAALGIQSGVIRQNAEQQQQLVNTTNTNTQTNQQNTDSIQQNTDAQEQNNQASSDGMSILKLMIMALDGARERTKALSDATGVLFEKLFLAQNQMEATVYSTEMAKILVELEKVKDKHAEVRTEIAKAGDASDEASKKILFGANSIIRFFGYVAKAEAEAKKAYYEQKLVADELVESLAKVEKTGAASFGSMGAAMHTLNVTSQTTIDSLSLLNEEDLSNLNSALEAAKQKLQDLQDEAIEAKDRIAELDAEIAKESGNEDASEKMQLALDRAQALRETEAMLAKARAENNRDLITAYEDQLRKLQTLYDLKEKNLAQTQRERQQKAEEDRQKSATNTDTSGSTTTTTTSGASNGKSGDTIINITGLTTGDFVRKEIMPEIKKVMDLRR